MQPAFKLLHGDCLTEMMNLPDESVDSLVTDPPAGISFMGKEWDDDKGGRDQWVAWLTEVMRECYRVLKPGAHGLVWAIPRTSHWTATALENAGFEVRDVITHLFGTGFPKSLDISKAIDKAAGAEREVIGNAIPGKTFSEAAPDSTGSHIWTGKLTSNKPITDAARQWSGWGTALKPASEHWILIRKPLGEKTVAANVLKHGTGGINIDGCRIEGGLLPSDLRNTHTAPSTNINFGGGKAAGGAGARHNPTGRFPANLVLSHNEDCEAECAPGCAVAELDRQSGPNCGAQAPVRKKATPETTNTDNYKKHTQVGDDGKSFRGDTGGASRFFYCAKASKKDRGEGNTHPTVKSTELMRYLCRLVTPPGGIVLDPFMGSGSTGVAAAREGLSFIGIEASEAYLEIAKTRIAQARK